MTDKHEPIETEVHSDPKDETLEDPALRSRRRFLLGLGKWSRAVIIGAVAGGALLTDRPARAGGWINRRGVGGGGWVNGAGGGGWVNHRGAGWGGSWINRR